MSVTALVRAAAIGDLAAVAALDLECFRTEAWSAASWADEFGRADRTVLVAGTLGLVVGYVVLIVPPDPRDPVDLTRIAVAPDERRTGVGARLLAAALAEVAGRTVLLEVAEGNESAIGLYAKAGFGEISRRRRYYGDADALIMRWETAGDD
jgi:ribosomal-protein-alanine N-acetyltransferase